MTVLWKYRPKLIRNSKCVLLQYHQPQKHFSFPLALSWICVCPTAASTLGLNSQDTRHGKKFLWLTWDQRHSVQPNKDKFRAGEKICHRQRSVCQMSLKWPGQRRKSSWLLRPLCSPKSKGFNKLHMGRFATPAEPGTAVHKERESWEKSQADLLGTISGSNLCEICMVQANLWRVCSIPPRG